MRFAHQCLASQLQQCADPPQGGAMQGGPSSSTTTLLHVPGVYLTLLEGALARDATSELVAAALQVRNCRF